MLLIDIPVGLITGQVIADAGRNMLKSGDRRKYRFLRTITIAFAFCFITPIVIYFFTGWPAWETNYMFREIDNIQNSPSLALVAGVGIVAMSLIPTLLGLISGRYLVRRSKEKLLRASYIGLAILILIIVLLSSQATFNIAATWTDYQNGNTFSFFENPFFTFWLVLTVWFYGSLLALFLWIRRKDKEV
jgi:magnesium-transporting ATPase (P-type)